MDADHAGTDADGAECPVCGMWVDPATAKHSLEHRGETVYFCNARCRERFLERPGRFLARKGGAAARGPAVPA